MSKSSASEKVEPVDEEHSAEQVEQTEQTEQKEVPTLSDMPQESANSSVAEIEEFPTLTEVAADEIPAEEGDQADAMLQLRDLVVGGTLRSLRKEIDCSQQVMLHRLEQLRQSTNKQMAVLGKQLVATRTEIQGEVQNRQQSTAHQLAEQNDINQSMLTQLSTLGESMEESFGDTQREHRSALAALEEGLIARMEERFDEIRTGAVSRSDFANLLRTMAVATVAEEGDAD